jgi:hypothetical protein
LSSHSRISFLPRIQDGANAGKALKAALGQMAQASSPEEKEALGDVFKALAKFLGEE